MSTHRQLGAAPGEPRADGSSKPLLMAPPLLGHQQPVVQHEGPERGAADIAHQRARTHGVEPAVDVRRPRQPLDALLGIELAERGLVEDGRAHRAQIDAHVPVPRSAHAQAQAEQHLGRARPAERRQQIDYVHVTQLEHSGLDERRAELGKSGLGQQRGTHGGPHGAPPGAPSSSDSCSITASGGRSKNTP